MKAKAIPFQAIDWTSIPRTEFKGAKGVAFWQTLQLQGLRIRIVEYSPGYLADHWCQKGHIVQCLEGEFVSELPCSKLIQFCYSPIWLHHLPVIENLRRQKAVGVKRWMKEQEEAWSNEWYLQRWIGLQKECENKLKQSLADSKDAKQKKE
jgi:hypothetical protein